MIKVSKPLLLLSNDNRLLQAVFLVWLLIFAHGQFVSEIAERLVHESRGVGHNPESPAESGYEHAALAVSLRDGGDDFARIAVLRVLRPECPAFVVFDHQAHEFHQVPDVEHAAAVLDFREYGQFLREFAEQRVVALAVLAENHGRAEDDHLERVAVQRADAVLGLHLAVAVAVRGVHGGVAGDDFLLADGGAVAIHDGAAHEYELLDSGLFRALGAGHGEVGVHGVVELGAFFADGPAIAVGDSGNVIDCVVVAEVVGTPSIANHVERIHLVLVFELWLS